MIRYPSITNYKEIMGRVLVPPAVSILLPFHPVFSSRAELQHRVKIALENARHRLLKDYSAETAIAIMDRLDKLRLQLRYDTEHKSVAFFASLYKSKLYYLDTIVEEKIEIGETFSVRELVADSKQLRQYLILALSDKECKFYLADEDRLTLLAAASPTEVFAYINEKPERVANFSDPHDRREIILDKFLHYMDRELSRILSLHPLPVFILGPEKVIGHFKMHSRHLAQIAGYVPGNYLKADESELRSVVQPCLNAWQDRNRQTLLDLLETAAGGQKLSSGILESWAATWHNNGRLLVVEQGFRFPAQRGDTPDHIVPENMPAENPFGIHDAVDALIGQIISQGGDVEFVKDGTLREYDRIALIRHY